MRKIHRRENRTTHDHGRSTTTLYFARLIDDLRIGSVNASNGEHAAAAVFLVFRQGVGGHGGPHRAK